jgi:predicted GNAT superfamily acetyltransferase
MQVTIRPVSTLAEYQMCVDLQRETWGPTFTECVPRTVLMIAHKVGGIVSGAFEANGRMLGFVFGLTGLRQGRAAHWSHMLAVRADAQGLGIGRALKLHQRELLLGMGVDVAYWTYDPLVARNAHLNLNRLGACIEQYVPDMYGHDTQSALHSGLGTDRLVVRWELKSPHVRQTLADGVSEPAGAEHAPVVNAVLVNGAPQPADTDLAEAPAVRVEIPWDIQQVKLAASETAHAWRRNTRRALQWYLERGYTVAALHRDPHARRCAYVLTRRD